MNLENKTNSNGKGNQLIMHILMNVHEYFTLRTYKEKSKSKIYRTIEIIKKNQNQKTRKQIYN